MEIGDVFKDKDKEEGTGVMDLINRLVEILRLETGELWEAAWEALVLVKPWDEG